MTCFLSSSCFKNATLNDVIAFCQKEHIFNLEWSAPHPYQSTEAIVDLLQKSQNQGFTFLPHNYFPPVKNDFVLNIASEDNAVLDAVHGLIKAMLDVSEAIKMPLYGIHAGYLADAYVGEDGMFTFAEKKLTHDQALSRTQSFVSDILPDFQRANVRLLLENLFPTEKGEYSLYCSYEEIKECMSAVGSEVGLLLDLGHLNVTSTRRGISRNKFLEKYLAEFGSRIYEVHLSENNGYRDEHLPVLDESWQLEIIREIESIPLENDQSRRYCLEARNSDGIDVLKHSLTLINDSLAQTVPVF